MKNKSLKVVLLCAISSFVLAGCANPLSKLTNKSDSEEATEIVEEQQVVHLNNVTAGTVIDNETLISYAMSLSGESDIASAICSTETETNLTELVLEEGIHTVTISYTKSDGSTGETQMTYKADPATEEQVEDTVEVEDGTEAEDTEEQSESIPIEGRIYLINQAINTVDSLDEYSMSEDIDKDSLVYTKDLSTELEFNEAPVVYNSGVTVYNSYSIGDDGEPVYQYYNDDYKVDIYHTYYVLDDVVIIEVSSDSSDDVLYYIYSPLDGLLEAEGDSKNTEDTTSTVEYSDELYAALNAVDEALPEYYSYEWTYDSKVIEDKENPSAEIEVDDKTETKETVEEIPEDSYRALHKDLYTWYPEPTMEFSRWDYRITDSTSFSSTITLADGTIIPQAQQNQEGYVYDFANKDKGSSNTGNSNSFDLSNQNKQEEEETKYVLEAGFEKFEIISYPAEGFEIDTQNSTSSKVIVKYNGSNYIITSMKSDDWMKYNDTDYYGNNYTDTEIVSTDSFNIGSGLNTAIVTGRSIQFKDSTNATEEREYMYGINCNTEYLVVVGDDLPGRGNSTLSKIAKNCIIPIAANEE